MGFYGSQMIDMQGFINCSETEFIILNKMKVKNQEM